MNKPKKDKKEEKTNGNGHSMFQSINKEFSALLDNPEILDETQSFIERSQGLIVMSTTQGLEIQQDKWTNFITNVLSATGAAFASGYSLAKKKYEKKEGDK